MEFIFWVYPRSDIWCFGFRLLKWRGAETHELTHRQRGPWASAASEACWAHSRQLRWNSLPTQFFRRVAKLQKLRGFFAGMMSLKGSCVLKKTYILDLGLCYFWAPEQKENMVFHHFTDHPRADFLGIHHFQSHTGMIGMMT